jgi:hypothetical protein
MWNDRRQANLSKTNMQGRSEDLQHSWRNKQRSIAEICDYEGVMLLAGKY